jgi:hypothetical protein
MPSPEIPADLSPTSACTSLDEIVLRSRNKRRCGAETRKGPPIMLSAFVRRRAPGPTGGLRQAPGHHAANNPRHARSPAYARQTRFASPNLKNNQRKSSQRLVPGNWPSVAPMKVAQATRQLWQPRHNPNTFRPRLLATCWPDSIFGQGLCRLLGALTHRTARSHCGASVPTALTPQCRN